MWCGAALLVPGCCSFLPAPAWNLSDSQGALEKDWDMLPAVMENEANASSLAATARTTLLWMPSVAWGLAQCSVRWPFCGVQRGSWIIYILYPVNIACMLIQMVKCGANYKELIFFSSFHCAHHFTVLGCEVQINTQKLPCGDRRTFCYIQLLLHYIWYRNWEKWTLSSLQKKCINIFDG